MYLNRATLIYMVPSNATSPTALAQQWQLQLINGPLAGWQLYTPTPPPSWTLGHAIWRAPKQQQQLLCYYPAVIASSWQGMSSSPYDTKAAMAAFWAWYVTAAAFKCCQTLGRPAPSAQPTWQPPVRSARHHCTTTAGHKQAVGKKLCVHGK